MGSNLENREKKHRADGTTTGRTDTQQGSPPQHPEISHIVGIGASAGGIEAFGDFLEALSSQTGMAFILIQHLDPTHESLLDQIFQRKTTVPVEQAAEGMPVQPDHVYIIPPNKHIRIEDGKLLLAPRSEGKFMPIDTFLTSLAGSWGIRTIGIILSGTGKDGTEGIRAIKAAGGFTFVQDERTARYPDMPRNAIAAGGADFILPPDRIALELARIAKNPRIALEPPDEEPEPQEESDHLLQIYRLLKTSAGIDFSNYKTSTIRRRIARRTAMAKLETLDEYLDYLKSHPEETEALVDDLFINVTSFFRDPEIFDLLRKDILPELLKKRPPHTPVRVWVPGCSTGEEVYSLAICLMEAAGDTLSPNLVQIFGTDISDRIVEKARSGLFSESIAVDVSKERLSRFFRKTDGGYQITKELRDFCIFARQDLTCDPPFSRMDLISCRNLLIYLAAPQQKKIISTFHYSLNPSGILVLGLSESVGGYGSLFTLIDKKYKIYQKKQGVTAQALEHPLPGPKGVLPERTGKAVAEIAAFDAQKEADRIILASYAPASILVNEQMDILLFRGAAGRYVEPSSGTASLNLMKMLKERLLLEVRSLISKVRKENVAVHRNEVPFTIGGKEEPTHISVVPVRPVDAGIPRHFLVVFRPSVASVAREGKEERFSDENREQQFEQLRHDLQAAREYLQSTIEEKDAMNEEFRSAIEEIQSSNEELQSTNEELETTKEELQSTNEELITVNEELQNRNMELSRINDDLINLLNNVSLPLVILTIDLRIRRYTAVAENILNFIPSDLGRPFSDLRTKINLPDMEELFHMVLNDLIPREREVRDLGGKWHRLRIKPYTTQEKKIDGLVLTLVDIDEVKQAMEMQHRLQLFSEAVIQTIREPLLVLNPDLRVALANRSYYQFFQVTPAETEGNYIYNLGNGQWNIPRLRELLEEILPRDTSFNDLEIEHEFPRIGRRRMVLNARKVHEEGMAGEQKILLAIEEQRGTA